MATNGPPLTGQPYVVAESSLRPVAEIALGLAFEGLYFSRWLDDFGWIARALVLAGLAAIAWGCWTLFARRYPLAADRDGVWFQGRHFVPWNDIREVRSIRWTEEEEGSRIALLVALDRAHHGMPYTARRYVLDQLAIAHLDPAAVILASDREDDVVRTERVLRAAMVDETFRSHLGKWTPPRGSPLLVRLEGLFASPRRP